MPKINRVVLNRGRFQAQGDGLEKSRPWAQEDVPTKSDGHAFLDELKGKLTPSELAVRATCFEKAKKWVDKSPRQGHNIVSPMKPSFLPSPPIRSIRVDGELYSGVAFKDDDR